MKKVSIILFVALFIIITTSVSAGSKSCTTSTKIKEVILKNSNKKAINIHRYQKFHLSFYTSLPSENMNDGTGVDCHGNPLVYGTIANNKLPYGTKIHLNGLGNFVVRDVGAERYFSNEDEIDVFIPRNAGESNQQYYNRVNNMGRIIVQGYIINK